MTHKGEQELRSDLKSESRAMEHKSLELEILEKGMDFLRELNGHLNQTSSLSKEKEDLSPTRTTQNGVNKNNVEAEIFMSTSD